MAQRLKGLRTEKGLSHESLRKMLIEKYEIDISIDSLKNYEVSKTDHAKAYKNEGMRVEYLRVFADFYNVSSDFILGLTDVRNADPTIAKMCEYTGLSEQALSELSIKKAMGIGSGLNVILETPNAGLLLSGLEKYYWDIIAAYIIENDPCANIEEYPVEIANALYTRLQIHNTLENVVSNSGIEFLTVSDMYAAKATHLLTNTLYALEHKAKKDLADYLSFKK
jgi:hypothetical protein